MKLNIIVLCLILWGVVCFISAVIGLFRLIQAKRNHSLQMIYLRQFMFLAKRGLNAAAILKELHHSFIDKKNMRKIIIKAMRMPTSQGLDYIYGKMGCEPMKILHGFVIGREQNIPDGQPSKIPEDIIQYFYNLIEEWDKEVIHNGKQQNRRNIKAFMELIVFILLDLALYTYVQTDISLFIFAIANTLGVIMFIILTNEGYIVDKKYRDGKLASRKKQKKTRSHGKLIQNLYQLACGTGLIINIFIIVADWLGPVT